MSNFNKTHLARTLKQELSKKNDFSCTDIVNHFITSIRKAILKGHRVHFRELGTFKLVRTKPRIGRDRYSHKGKSEKVEVIIPERTIVRFKTAKNLNIIAKNVGIPDNNQ